VPSEDKEALAERLAKLMAKMDSVRETSLEAELMVQRVSGDLMRMMNSALLNLSDIESITNKIKSQSSD
jgi:hypothetical protein